MKLNLIQKTVWVALFFAVLVIANAQAQTFGTLVDFNAEDGAFPISPLTEGIDGVLYGTTYQGGFSNECGLSDWGCGTVLIVPPYPVLYSFCAATDCADGSLPTGGLVQTVNGDFYGTTQGGYNYNSPCGFFGCGTIFKINYAGGGLSTLHTFNYTDGAVPSSGLVQASDGNFYGTTTQGGANGNHGTIFKITPAGQLTTIYNFCAQTNCADGESPVGPLIQATNGNLYGTSIAGGSHGYGSIFEVTRAGKLTTLYSFCAQAGCPDGAAPAGVVQGSDGNFYGTTEGGNCPGWCGTVFKITPSGKLTTLYRFCEQTGCPDGDNPLAGVIQANDGNFYGTTSSGGVNGNYGTVFKITPSGSLTTLYSFCSQPNCTDGSQPMASLLQDTNGNLDGTTYFSAVPYFGTAFSLALGLPPFVISTPASGKVGLSVIVTGNLYGVTAVSFNGTPTTFAVVTGPPKFLPLFLRARPQVIFPLRRHRARLRADLRSK